MTSSAAPFGTQFCEQMALAKYADQQWQPHAMVPVEPLSIHPGAHVLHYSSTCFEGLKTFKMKDGSAKIFRLDMHLDRFRRSAELLCMPLPARAELETMIRKVVAEGHAKIPVPPGALYLRPTLIGTEANIGAAGTPSSEVLLYILGAPVGDYFTGGTRALRILIEEQQMRSTPGFGQAKTGGNYAAALRHVIAARQNYQADQVLFCPHGDVQETGASNFFLLNDKQLLTKPLDESFLHGVTRDSIITIAKDLGYEVIEKNFTVDDLKHWVKTGEAALSGTAAVLTGVGTFIHNGEEIKVADGNTGPNTQRLRAALTAIQFGEADDKFGWLT